MHNFSDNCGRYCFKHIVYLLWLKKVLISCITGIIHLYIAVILHSIQISWKLLHIKIHKFSGDLLHWAQLFIFFIKHGDYIGFNIFTWMKIIKFMKRCKTEECIYTLSVLLVFFASIPCILNLLYYARDIAQYYGRIQQVWRLHYHALPACLSTMCSLVMYLFLCNNLL